MTGKCPNCHVITNVDLTFYFYFFGGERLVLVGLVISLLLLVVSCLDHLVPIIFVVYIMLYLVLSAEGVVYL